MSLVNRSFLAICRRNSHHWQVHRTARLWTDVPAPSGTFLAEIHRSWTACEQRSTIGTWTVGGARRALASRPRARLGGVSRGHDPRRRRRRGPRGIGRRARPQPDLRRAGRGPRRLPPRARRGRRARPQPPAQERYRDHVLYSTLEPCLLCVAATMHGTRGPDRVRGRGSLRRRVQRCDRHSALAAERAGDRGAARRLARAAVGGAAERVLAIAPRPPAGGGDPRIVRRGRACRGWARPRARPAGSQAGGGASEPPRLPRLTATPRRSAASASVRHSGSAWAFALFLGLAGALLVFGLFFGRLRARLPPRAARRAHRSARAAPRGPRAARRARPPPSPRAPRPRAAPRPPARPASSPRRERPGRRRSGSS